MFPTLIRIFPTLTCLQHCCLAYFWHVSSIFVSCFLFPAVVFPALNCRYLDLIFFRVPPRFGFQTCLVLSVCVGSQSGLVAMSLLLCTWNLGCKDLDGQMPKEGHSCTLILVRDLHVKFQTHPKPFFVSRKHLILP